MARKSKKNVKNQAPAEEPKNKRARKLAEELNAEELRALLAAKLSGTPLSPAGLEFAVPDEDSDVVPKPDEELDGVQCDEDGAKGDDILGNEGDGEHADGGDGAPADGGDDASQSQGVFVRGLNRSLFF